MKRKMLSTRRWALLALLLVALLACGRLPGNFDSLPLEKKVAAYEKSLEASGRSRIQAQAQISRHGWPAADLMARYIDGTRQGLPPHEAIEIVHLIQTRGCSLQGTAAEKALRGFLAREPEDSADHLLARTALEAIENNVVRSNRADVLKGGPCEGGGKDRRPTP